MPTIEHTDASRRLGIPIGEVVPVDLTSRVTPWAPGSARRSTVIGGWIICIAGVVAAIAYRSLLPLALAVGALLLDATVVKQLRLERRIRRKWTFEPSKRKRPSRLAWESMVREARGRCFYCGSSALELEADHVFPVSRGGVSLPVNLVVACKDCNRRKRDKTGPEFVDDPSPEQQARFEAIDQLMRARRLTSLQRQDLHRAEVMRQNDARLVRQAMRDSVKDARDAERFAMNAGGSWEKYGGRIKRCEIPSGR